MGIQTPSASSDLPHLNVGFEPEMDEFLDLDQNVAKPSSTSADIKYEKSSAGQSTARTSIDVGQSQQTFSGPSFQYDSYKQQTGIPAGGLANTFALNQATGMQYTGYGNGFVMPTETLNAPLTTVDEFDFAAYPPMDMDLEADSSTDNLSFSPTAPATFKGAFVNPNVLLEHERKSSGSASTVQRMYPGMHSQIAKAQEAQKQTKAAQQPQPPPSGQRPLPNSSKALPARDPHVEESISRLLNQMRQSSVASANDESATSTANLSSLARPKKDEEEMDKDERLLVSEEGKRLSSKERRQLRNKVSARAFRSRRKEYIGQLEGEVALKTQEADDLKVRNENLLEENRRLTDLTRMLLSSQAFSGFVNDLSGTGPSVSTNNTQPPPSKSHSQPESTQKDINPNEIVRQLQDHQQQAGTTILPDIPLVDHVTSAPSWNGSIGQNFPVYAVTNIPQWPALDAEELSGKADNRCPLHPLAISKPDRPIIEHTEPFSDAGNDCPLPVADASSETDFNEAVFPLFVESPCETLQPSAPQSPTASHLSCPKILEPHFRSILQGDDAEAMTAARLQAMCTRLDATSARIAAVTPHMI